MELTREAAWALLTEYTTGESLRKHALGVDAAVRGYARMFGEDETGWGIVALLHDFDYERWPSLDDHPFRGCEILRAKGYPTSGRSPSHFPTSPSSWRWDASRHRQTSGRRLSSFIRASSFLR